MRQDRTLQVIFVVILLIIALALGVFFTRRQTPRYMNDVSPKGVIHNYAVALLLEDYEKAYSYLKEGENKPSLGNFRNAFLTRQIDPTSTSLEIGSVRQNGDEAIVELLIIHNSTDPLMRGFTETNTATLIRNSSGEWKIANMPYPYWNWDWNNPPVEPPSKSGTD